MTEPTIVISGVPASGKSTLGRELATRLSVPLFDKDDFLEARFRDTPFASDDRHALSREADGELVKAVTAEPRCVVVSFWRRPELSRSSGTPTAWLGDLPSMVEVYCDCDPTLSAERFHARTRHPNHGDSTKDLDATISALKALYALGPLGIGRVLRVRTDEALQVDSILDAL